MIPLRPGQQIAVVAPASPFDTAALDTACTALEAEGYGIRRSAHLQARTGYLAGTEAERAEDLMEAIRDPEVSAIWCARGGYGSARLLPWLPFGPLRDNRKIFIGHSDITFLHLAFSTRMNWVTFHGPNLAELGTRVERIPEALSPLTGTGGFDLAFSEAQVLRHGIGTGTTVGCNLTCVTHLLGTPFFPTAPKILLLVEDRGEALYRIDRLFNHLRLAGILDRVEGLLLGQFTDCDAEARVSEVILEHVRDFRFPVVRDLPFGHVTENRVLPIGLSCRLDTYEHAFRPVSSPFSG
jgi:muramoyltetrapeptide carboxypeptidase